MYYTVGKLPVYGWCTLTCSRGSFCQQCGMLLLYFSSLSGAFTAVSEAKSMLFNCHTDSLTCGIIFTVYTY